MHQQIYEETLPRTAWVKVQILFKKKLSMCLQLKRFNAQNSNKNKHSSENQVAIRDFWKHKAYKKCKENYGKKLGLPWLG